MALLLFGALYAVLAWFYALPRLTGALYLVLSVVCFGAYARDKAAARAGQWRIPEKTFLLMGLAGGWPGALLAQQLLRHKSSKPSLRRLLWSSVLVNIATLACLTHCLHD